MSQPDLPLWARGLAAGLMVFAAWWLLHTSTIRNPVGESVALVSLPIVAAFMLRGMHLPLHLWPPGPWRPSFSTSLVVTVALVFGVAIVASDPLEAETLRARLDPGRYALVVSGVVAWGFSWAFVRQHHFARWYGLAVAAALVPLLVGGAALAMREDWSALCVWTTGGGAPASACDTGGLRALGYLAAVETAAALVTVELAFRRVLIGQPGRAGLALIVGAAAVALIWSLTIGSDKALALPWWLVGAASVGAGSLYVLSGSLLVSALYTGLVVAGTEALALAAPAASTAEGGTGQDWAFLATHALVTILLAAVATRRQGIFTGLR